MQSKNSTGGNGASVQSARGRNGDLLVRTASALILGPAVLAAAWYGGWVFRAVLCVLALLTALEWMRLVAPEGPRRSLIMALAAVAVVLGMGVWTSGGPTVAAAALLSGVLLLAVRAGGARHFALVALTVPYVGLGAYALMWLRDRPGTGLGLLTYVLLVVWATDIGAYAAGRTIGGPKLAPAISPKKTWAGLIGGMASAALAGAAVALAFVAGGPGTAVPAALLAGVLAVVAQAGDLFESAIKRRYGVKDSGHIIPGHGGLLDRVDGLIAAAPVFALVHAALGTTEQWW